MLRRNPSPVISLPRVLGTVPNGAPHSGRSDCRRGPAHLSLNPMAKSDVRRSALGIRLSWEPVLEPSEVRCTRLFGSGRLRPGCELVFASCFGRAKMQRLADMWSSAPATVNLPLPLPVLSHTSHVNISGNTQLNMNFFCSFPEKKFK